MSEGIQMNKVSTLTSAWMKRYNELKEFYLKHGHSDVPSDFHQNPQDVYAKLGRWVAKQRYNYKLYTGDIVSEKYKTLMTEEKIRLMDALDFRWETESRRMKGKLIQNDKLSASSWNNRFEELKVYKEKNGDCMVPYKYPQNVQLGRWVSVQRYMYNELQKGKKSSMTQTRIDLLNSLGFVWDASEKSFGGKEFVSHWQKKACSDDIIEKKGLKEKRSFTSNGAQATRKKQQINDAFHKIFHIDGMSPGESMFDRYVLKLASTTNDEAMSPTCDQSKIEQESSGKSEVNEREGEQCEWV